MNPGYSADFTCETYTNRNSVCYWKGVQCSQLDLDADFVIKVGSSGTSITGQYTLSLKALTTDVTQSTRTDCDMFITELHNETENIVVLGDPWLSAFMPIFDVDNDQIGLAVYDAAPTSAEYTAISPNGDDQGVEQLIEATIVQ